MADQDKPSFYPRVGNIRQKSGQSPLQKVIDKNLEQLQRGPELPQWGDIDLSVPTAANRQISERLAQEDERQRQQALSNLSPLQKVAAAMQAARVAGSGVVQSIASMPTELMQGPAAAQKQMMEGMYKPTMPEAYDYLEEALDPINKALEAAKLPSVMPEVSTIGMIPSGLARAQARSLMGRGISKAEQAIAPFVNRTMERGGMGAELLGGLTQGTRSNVMKPKNENWMTGSVEGQINTLKRNRGIMTPEQIADQQNAIETAKRIVGEYGGPEANPEHINAINQMQREIDESQRINAINNWADRNLTNYVKKEMATPEDPVRKLAEQGITHYPVAEDPGYWARHGATAREERGGEAMAQSPLAKQWENRTDAMIDRNLAQEHQDMMNLAPGMYSDKDAWIKKLDPSTQLYSAHSRHFSPLDLGFDHILDVLREDLATGRIRPEQLSKVSMEQAVRRTYEYDQELAKKMAEARAASREGLPVYKEYPEGFRWVELNKPGAFATESEAMGHSVRGYEPPKGHADWIEGSGTSGSHGYGHGGWEAIKSGKAKVYSLVDPKGNPHVTVEVGPSNRRKEVPVSQWLESLTPEQKSRVINEGTGSLTEHPEYLKFIQNLDSPPTITQIKGKQNAAPKEEYLPFVQDFVRSGKWSDVGDIQNTGMRATRDIFSDNEIQNLRELGEVDLPHIMSGDEIQRYHNMIYKEGNRLKYDSRGNIIGMEGDDGMKRGGKVHISDNPDTMQLELAGGGITKLAKLARAPAKSKAEIEAVAERIAPQLTGEFVRGEKGTQSVAGKTQKQFAREKELKHDIRGEMPTPGTIDYEKLKDQVVIGIPGDPTITGKSIHAVGETPLESPSPQHGGPLYGLGRDDSHFWASQLGAARRVQNLAREAGQQYEAPVLGQYIMMGPESINYAQHFADANLSAIDPTKMSKKQLEGFNKLLREGSQASGPRPGFPGIENKEEAYLQMAIDPELRKHFNALMQMPTVTERFGLPSGIDVRHAVTEPALRDLETGVTGHSVGQMRPEVEDLKLSAHPTYSHDIPGHFLGQSKYPIPYEIMFPDTLQAIRANPKQAPHEFGSLKMVGPRQQIDQQLIDEIKMYEEMVKKLTGKAAGGAITGAALKAMERLKELKAEAALKADVWKAKQAADESKYTQDINAMTPEMMRAEIERMQNPVKKAAGGEITADELILEERPL